MENTTMDYRVTSIEEWRKGATADIAFLYKEQIETRVDVKYLVKVISAQTKVLWGVFGILLTALVSFFFAYILNIGGITPNVGG